MPFTQPILPFGDTARARRSDPLPSHVAADKSAATRGRVAVAVLHLVETYGARTGQELNDLYRANRADMGWPVVAFDSPRKRAGELAAAGDLVVTNPDDPRGTPAVYDVPVDMSNFLQEPAGSEDWLLEYRGYYGEAS